MWLHNRQAGCCGADARLPNRVVSDIPPRQTGGANSVRYRARNAMNAGCAIHAFGRGPISVPLIPGVPDLPRASPGSGQAIANHMVAFFTARPRGQRP